jgi:3-oxoacyl-[acyl-carrier protein] reductase
LELKLLADDTAIVTGAGAGIGRAIAQAVGREGARVLLSDIAATAGESAAAGIVAAGGRAAFVAADLRDPQSAKTLLDAAVKQFGPVSILVHAASPLLRLESLDDITDEAWQQMIDINAGAGFRLGRLLARHMLDHQIKGRMLFITSLHAESPRAAPHYSVAKAGLTMLMKELARALGPAGIRVNAIAPGSIMPSPQPWDAKLSTSLQRHGSPEEVAQTAVAVLSERFGSYIAGTTIVVDGGLALFNWIPSPTVPGQATPGAENRTAMTSGRHVARPTPDFRLRATLRATKSINRVFRAGAAFVELWRWRR